MRELNQWKALYEECKKAFNGDMGRVALTMRARFHEYFRSEAGQRHIAESPHADKSVDEITDLVMKTVHGWIKEDEAKNE